MLGGYQIINLTGINVALNSEMTAISDRGVLIQLLALREYIEDNYNFTRPLNKKLKPVMLRLRDKESGEKTESCVWANIAVIDDNLSFNIDAIVSVNPLKVLQINVVFQKLQDEDENDYYDIKSAGYLYKGGNDVVTVSDIKDIDSDIIDKLQCGDIVLKHDSSGDHAYIVSYRGATGICLTYADASVIETQSYDLINEEWIYNSEDKTTFANFLTASDIEGGTIDNAKPIYCHPISIVVTNADASIYARLTCLIFSNSPTEFTAVTFTNWLKELYASNNTARLMLSGAVTKSGSTIIASYMRWTGSLLEIIGLNSSTGLNEAINATTMDGLFSSSYGFYDGVNKIN